MQSAGLWGDGQLHAPDLYHRTLLPKNINTIEVTKEGFEEIVRAIKKEQEDRKLSPGQFNIVSNNCSCFAAKIAAQALKWSLKPHLTDSDDLFEEPLKPIPIDSVVEHADAATNLSIVNSLPTRLKCYYASQELYQALTQNKEKSLDLLQKIELALMSSALLVSASPENLAGDSAININQILQKAFESELIENAAIINKLSFLPLLLEAIGNLQNLSTIRASLTFFKDLMRELIVDIQRGEKLRCINKLFNFEMQLLKCISSLEIKHPYILFQNLSHTDLSRSVASLSRAKK
jgi:hypothetical protein